MNVADKILEQLGGQKFVVMTGASHFVANGNTLRMVLPKNVSKANRLYITLDATDTYTMRFVKYTAGHLNKRTFAWIGDKTVEVKTISSVFCDDLQAIFTEVTGMYTHL